MEQLDVLIPRMYEVKSKELLEKFNIEGELIDIFPSSRFKWKKGTWIMEVWDK